VRVHLRARQYDAGTGRFLSTDPLTLPMSDPHVAAYIYVANRPTAATDPSGRCLQFAGAGLVLAPATGGSSAAVGTAATVACGVVVGGIALIGIGAAWVLGSKAGEALSDATRSDQPVYDPRTDPETDRRALELLQRTFDEVGNLRPGGLLPGGCRDNMAKCLIAYGLGATLVIQAIAAATRGNTVAEDAYRCRDPKLC
jgi:hypothetical protein